LDGDGKRRRIEDSGGLRNLIWDLENILVETDSNDATAAAYTLAPEVYGELISQRRSGATSFHHFDALGSTNKLTDSSANTLAEYLYRAFGQQTVLSGSSANPFTWVGKLGYYRQPDASDYWVRARVMKPTLGRWASRDPLLSVSWLGSLLWHEPLGNQRQVRIDRHQKVLSILKDARYSTISSHYFDISRWLEVEITVLGTLPYRYCPDSPVVSVDPSGRSPWFALIACVICAGILAGGPLAGWAGWVHGCWNSRRWRDFGECVRDGSNYVMGIVCEELWGKPGMDVIIYGACGACLGAILGAKIGETCCPWEPRLAPARQPGY
jgi:hypothetical protein